MGSEMCIRDSSKGIPWSTSSFVRLPSASAVGSESHGCDLCSPLVASPACHSHNVASTAVNFCSRFHVNNEIFLVKPGDVWFFGILRSSTASQPPCVSSTQAAKLIPVRISSRQSKRVSSRSRGRRWLVRQKVITVPRQSKRCLGFSILYFNARSLKNKIDELSLRCVRVRRNPDIIAITETWADFSVPDSYFSIQNYVIFRCDRGNNGGGYILSSIVVS